MEPSARTLQLLLSNEGYRAAVYCDACGRTVQRQPARSGNWQCHDACPGGNLTIGYGIRVDGSGLSGAEARELLLMRLAAIDQWLGHWNWYDALAEPRKAALQDMVYQLGRAGFDEFIHLIAACEAGQWTAAVAAIVASRYYKQVPARAGRNAELLRSGTW